MKKTMQRRIETEEKDLFPWKTFKKYIDDTSENGEEIFISRKAASFPR